MADLDFQNTTQTDMEGTVTDASVTSYSPDTVGEQKETVWFNSAWHSQMGYFKGDDVIPQFYRAMTVLSTWSYGQGWTADNATTVLLDGITGRGNQSFSQIAMSMGNTKKVTGDAYAHAIRNQETGTLINLKILGGDVMRVIFGADGLIIRYEQISRSGFIRRLFKLKPKVVRTFKPLEILHLSNEVVDDEIHGTALADIVKWVMVAKKQSMEDYKRVSHRSTIRVMYIDSMDDTKMTRVKTQYATAIDKGELIIIPAKKGEAEFQDLDVPPIQAFKEYWQYLDDIFYQVIGTPKSLLAIEGVTESGGKMGSFNFQPAYIKEQKLMEEDLWNQLGIRVKFNSAPTLGGGLAQDEAKDPAAFQPSDTVAGVGR